MAVGESDTMFLSFGDKENASRYEASVSVVLVIGCRVGPVRLSK